MQRSGIRGRPRKRHAGLPITAFLAVIARPKAVAIQGGGCVVTVVAMAMALWIATAFQASR